MFKTVIAGLIVLVILALLAFYALNWMFGG